MDQGKKFSFRQRGIAFVYAWRGLKALVRHEHNARIHLCAAALCVAFGFFFGITATEWCLVVICMGMVIAAEALNSGIEVLADRITRDKDPFIGLAKDYGAAAVTLLAVASLIVGLVIFLPYILKLIVR